MREQSPLFSPNEMLQDHGLQQEQFVQIDAQPEVVRWRQLKGIRDGLDKLRGFAIEQGKKVSRTIRGKETIDQFLKKLPDWQREDFDDFIEVATQRIVAEKPGTDPNSFEFSKEGVEWLQRWVESQRGSAKQAGGRDPYQEMVNHKRFNEFERLVYTQRAQKDVLLTFAQTMQQNFMGGTSVEKMNDILHEYEINYPFMAEQAESARVRELAINREQVQFVMDQNRRLITLRRAMQIAAEHRNNLAYDPPAEDKAFIDPNSGKYEFPLLFGLRDVVEVLTHREGADMGDMLALFARGYDFPVTVKGERKNAFGPVELLQGFEDGRFKASAFMRAAAIGMAAATHEHGDFTKQDDLAYGVVERSKSLKDIETGVIEQKDIENVKATLGFTEYKAKMLRKEGVRQAAQALVTYAEQQNVTLSLNEQLYIEREINNYLVAQNKVEVLGPELQSLVSDVLTRVDGIRSVISPSERFAIQPILNVVDYDLLSQTIEHPADDGFVHTYTTDDEFAVLYLNKLFYYRTWFWRAGDLTWALHPHVGSRKSSYVWSPPHVFYDHADAPSGKTSATFRSQTGIVAEFSGSKRNTLFMRMGMKNPALLAYFVDRDFERLSQREIMPDPVDVYLRLRSMTKWNKKVNETATKRSINSRDIFSSFTGGEGAGMYSDDTERREVMARLIQVVQPIDHDNIDHERNPDKVTATMVKDLNEGAFFAEQVMYHQLALGYPITFDRQLLPKAESRHIRAHMRAHMAWRFDDDKVNLWGPEYWAQHVRELLRLPEHIKPWTGGVVVELGLKFLFREFRPAYRSAQLNRYVDGLLKPGVRLQDATESDFDVLTMDDFLAYFNRKRVFIPHPDHPQELYKCVWEEDDGARNGLPEHKRKALDRIVDADLGAMVVNHRLYRQNPNENYPVLDKTSLRTDLHRWPIEMAEIYHKFFDPTLAYGNGVLEQFQMEANARKAPHPTLSQEVRAVSAGKELDGNQTYRWGEARPVVAIRSMVYSMLYNTALEEPPRPQASFGVEKVAVNNGQQEIFLYPTANPEFVDPYLDQFGLAQPGKVSLETIRNHGISRADLMYMYDIALGTEDMLNSPSGLSSSDVYRRPIQFAESFLEKELDTESIQGSLSYVEADLVREVCMELGVPYRYADQQHILSQYPEIKREVDNRFVNTQRYFRVFTPLDYFRLISRSRIYTPLQKKELMQLYGCSMKLREDPTTHAVVPFEGQAAQFWEMCSIRLGIQDKEFSEFLKHMDQQEKEDVLETWSSLTSGVIGNNVPAVALNLVSRGLKKAPPEAIRLYVVDGILKGGGLGLSGGVVTGLIANAYAPGALLITSIGGTLIGAGVGTLIAGLERFGGLQQIWQGFYREGDATILTSGPTEVLRKLDAFRNNFYAGNYVGGMDILDVVTSGKPSYVMSRMEAMYQTPRSSIFTGKAE